MFEDKIKITDGRGFIYDVLVKHTPQFGFSTAYYYEHIIAQCEYGCINPHMGDNDREWE